jgi:hypothetical protein
MTAGRLRLLLTGLVALAPLAGHAAPAARTSRAPAGCGGGICLAVTVTTDPPPACGTATSIAVASDTRVNFCYTVTNGSGVELGYHTLDDDADGQIFWLLGAPLAPGASYQYNRVATIFENTTVTSTWTAQDVRPDYAPTVAPSGNFIDITGIGTALDIGNEHLTGITLPFPFEFYGRTSEHLCVSSDGFALFDLWPCPPYAYYAPQPLPTDAMPAPAFMPLWEELTADSGGIYAATLGTAPDRRFVVEWHDRPPYGNTDGFTFELILDETSGQVSFEYADVDTVPPESGRGVLGTVGLQANGSLADQFSNFTPSLTSGMGIAWTPNAPDIHSATASASVSASGATLTLSPVVLRESAISGAPYYAALSIGNAGSAPLTWSLAETTRSRAPHGNAAVPSFAEDLASGEFVRFDAADPAALTPVAATDYRLSAGDFVDDDPTRLYAIDGASPAHRNAVVMVDTTSGAVTEIGTATPPGSTHWSGLKWDPTDDALYGVASDCGWTNSTLYRISRSTGFAERVGPVAGSTGHNCVVDIAINAHGDMFGIESGFDNALVAIDKTTGAAQRIGPLGVEVSGDQGLDFDDTTGILYWARYDDAAPGGPISEMRTINTATAATTLIAPIATGAQIDALAIGTAGNCSNPEDIPWLSMNPPSGTTQAGDAAEVSVMLDATDLTAGTYRAMLCVSSNDRTTPLQQLPVEFTVFDANDVIFRDGFDGG